MTYRPDEAVDWLVQHYSATFTDTEYTPEQLERDHLARGFREPGYHFYITFPRSGKPARIVEGRDLSQPGRFEQGAHSQGENDRSIGICIEGGLTRQTGNNVGVDTRHPDQIRLQVQLIDRLLKRFGGDGLDDKLGPVVEGHRDMPGAATQCPGYDARIWWAGVQRERGTPRPPAAQPGLLQALSAIIRFLTRRTT